MGTTSSELQGSGSGPRRGEPVATILTAVTIGVALALPEAASPVLSVAAVTLVFGGLLAASFVLDLHALRPLAGFALLAGGLIPVTPPGLWPLPALVALAAVTAADSRRGLWLRRGHADRRT